MLPVAIVHSPNPLSFPTLEFKFLRLQTVAVDTEKDLLEKIAAGDEAAFRNFYNQYHHLLGIFIYRLTQSMSEAEEIVQDVFLKLWMTRESLAAINDVRAYLFIVARNQALNAIDRRMRELARKQKWQREQLTFALNNEETDFRHSLIDTAIAQLPPQQKKVFLLSRYERLTYNEIAQQLHLSRETVKTYLQYATAAITKFIRGCTAEALLLLACISLQKFF